MLSAQKLLNTLNEIKEIAQLELALFQANGKIVVSTTDLATQVETFVNEFLEMTAKP